MKRTLLLSAALAIALAACGEQQETSGNGIAADQGYSVENSTANDVTAIDAATADASGMAADAEANLALPELNNEAEANSAGDQSANAN